MGIMPAHPILYLASQSPRRRELLNQIGVSHEVLAVSVDETLLSPHEPAVDYVRRLALEKARAGWVQVRRKDPLPVLGADTAVVVGEEILGKPANRDEGLTMLRLLAGRTHRVLTGVALCWDDQEHARVSVSEVSFRELTGEELTLYWDSGEPLDKAGAYAIQGLAALFVSQVSGSYSGVVGLPLYETGELLRIAGIYPL